MRKSLAAVALALAMAVAPACSHVPRRTQPVPTPNASPSPTPGAQMYGPPEPLGPPVPAPVASASPVPTYGPEPLQVRPITLVLGPGLARGFAYEGVISALAEAKVPVAAVFGTEMGALIGSLYGTSDTINSFEWNLERFRDEIFVDRPAFASLSKLFGKKSESPHDVGRSFVRTLRSVFGSRDLGAARFPVWVGTQASEAAPSMYVRHGSVAREVEESFRSPSQAHPFAIDQAKAATGGPVVVVDVLATAPIAGPSADERRAFDQMALLSRNSATELKDADLVIRPKLSLGYLDYSKRNDAAFRGRQAANEALPAIRHLAGMPDNGDEP